MAATDTALVFGVTALLSSVPALGARRQPDAGDAGPLSRTSSVARSDAGSEPAAATPVAAAAAAAEAEAEAVATSVRRREEERAGAAEEGDAEEDERAGVVAGMSLVFALAWGIGARPPRSARTRPRAVGRSAFLRGRAVCARAGKGRGEGAGSAVGRAV